MNASNRELLELAAKAAGINGKYYASDDYESIWWNSADDCVIDWNPLTDDSDALRLVVHLRLDVTFNDLDVFAFPPDGRVGGAEEINVDDPLAATRRAITRAAAAMGEKA